MYRCNKCDYKFDEPEYIKEKEIIDYGVGRAWTTIWEGEVCPYCESDDFEEHLNEKDEIATEDEILGVGLQDRQAVTDDGQGVASVCQA